MKPSPKHSCLFPSSIWLDETACFSPCGSKEMTQKLTIRFLFCIHSQLSFDRIFPLVLKSIFDLIDYFYFRPYTQAMKESADKCSFHLYICYGSVWFQSHHQTKRSMLINVLLCGKQWKASIEFLLRLFIFVQQTRLI